MRKISGIFMLACALLSCGKSSVAPTESVANFKAPATISQSFASTTVTTESALKTAVANAKPGDIITISGTINLTSTLQLLASGTSSAKINLTGGTLNCSGLSSGWGVKCNGSYWNITNMTIKNGPSCGLVFQVGGYNYTNNITTTANGDTGLQIYNGGHDDNITYCTSTENYDAAAGGENADGFTCKLSSGMGNKFDHCTAHHNSDDGWDLYGNPYTVTITNCTATNNGFGTAGDGNGFKLGSAGQTVPHTVTNCTSSYNAAAGYDGNGNTGHITHTGSTGTGNGNPTLFYRIY
jgi:hypothetical protein